MHIMRLLPRVHTALAFLIIVVPSFTNPGLLTSQSQSRSCVEWYNDETKTNATVGLVEEAQAEGWLHVKARQDSDARFKAQLVDCADNDASRLRLRLCPLLSKSSPVPTGWLHANMSLYRLADCVKMGICTTSLQCCSDSIAAHYAAQSGGHKNNFTLLNEIVQSRGCHSKPAPEDLVIHLRLGDVIELSKSDPLEMLVGGADPAHSAFYRTGIKSVQELLFDAEEAAVQRIHLVGGSHRPDFEGERGRKSFLYAHCLKSALSQAGYSVSLDTDSDADNAFCFMASAKKFVQSVGGYSRIIGHLVEKSGGHIFGRVF